MTLALNSWEHISAVLGQVDAARPNIDQLFLDHDVSPRGVATVAKHHSMRIEDMPIQLQLGAAVTIGIAVGLLCKEVKPE